MFELPVKLVFNGLTPASFGFITFFLKNKFQQNYSFSGIRTQIVRVEGGHADHLTTTTGENCCLPALGKI